MKRIDRRFVFGIAAFVLLGIGWLMTRPKPAAPSAVVPAAAALRDTDTAFRSAPARKTASAVKHPSEVAQHDLPDGFVPLDQAIPILREYADAGDVDAQAWLSIRLSVCTDHSLREARASDRRDLELNQQDKDDERLTEEARAVRTANVQKRLTRNAADRRACEQLPADLKAHWLDSVDRAAQSGSVDAMLTYAGLAIADYDSVGTIVADVDEAIQRRDKARAYLQEALQAGDTRSLRELSEAYANSSSPAPRLYAADASLSYAYAYASLLAGAIAQPTFDWMMSNRGDTMNAHQLAAAQAQGQRIYERCCFRH